MSHQPISDPSEFDSLSADELFERVQPLLRKGGLLTSYYRLERIKPNIPSVCFELGARWRQTPRLGEREVPFRDYFAARLCTSLRKLDREQHPNLYDPHGKYRPDGHTFPLEQEHDEGGHDEYIPQPAVTACYPIFAEVTAWPRQLETSCLNSAIAQPSLAALLRHVSNVEQGRTKTPYNLSRSMGLSPSHAHCQPATGPFVAIRDYLEGYTATASATGIG